VVSGQKRFPCCRYTLRAISHDFTKILILKHLHKGRTGLDSLVQGFNVRF